MWLIVKLSLQISVVAFVTQNPIKRRRLRHRREEAEIKAGVPITLKNQVRELARWRAESESLILREAVRQYFELF